MACLEPILMPNLKQGGRGWGTSNTTPPIWYRSPMRTSLSDGGKIFAEISKRKLARSVCRFVERVMFPREGVDRFVQSSMKLQVRLLITIDIEPAHHALATNRFAKNPVSNGLPLYSTVFGLETLNAVIFIIGPSPADNLPAAAATKHHKSHVCSILRTEKAVSLKASVGKFQSEADTTCVCGIF